MAEYWVFCKRLYRSKGVISMATLKDVAQKACVDVSTVSRALNNTSYVHPETKARIVAAAKELGYRPNVIAQALRQGRRHTLGVVVPRLHLTIFSEILRGIEYEAERLGYSTLISTTDDDPKREKSCLERLQNSYVDAIIIAGTGKNNRLLRNIQAGGIVVTQIVRCQEPRISSVVADYEACGRDAVNYLYAKGCRHIGLIAGYAHQSPFQRRYEGYSRAIAQYGLDELLVSSEQPVNSFEYGYECALQLLNDEPRLDSILAPVDLQGLGVLRALKEQDIKVPEQIKVISMTGHSIGRMLETGMTSMEMPAFEMGEKAAQLSIMEIEHPGEKPPTPQSIRFSYTLVEREST